MTSKNAIEKQVFNMLKNAKINEAWQKSNWQQL